MMDDAGSRTNAGRQDDPLSGGFDIGLQQTACSEPLNFSIQAFHQKAVASFMESNREAIKLSLNFGWTI